MGEKELTIFIVLVNIVLLIFIGGIIAFALLYRQRKIRYNQEKQLLAQKHQQDLINAQLEVQRQTMVDIGREIHDNIGQKLTLASIYSQSILHANKLHESDKQITEITKIINDSIADLRQISKSLVEPDLAQKSLIELLEQEVKHVNLIESCYLELKVNSAQINIGISTKNNLFRLSQEFIQNSLKHSNCKNIRIIIELKNEFIYFCFNDDGIGFDTTNKMNGIGLSNIKRRINELEAIDYNFISEIGKGTTLKFIIKI